MELFDEIYQINNYGHITIWNYSMCASPCEEVIELGTHMSRVLPTDEGGEGEVGMRNRRLL